MCNLKDNFTIQSNFSYIGELKNKDITINIIFLNLIIHRFIAYIAYKHPSNL